jgi:hypothetical protein
MDANEDSAPKATPDETYNPWTVVNLVFKHLAKEGLHPVLGEAGDPGKPAAELLTALGITPDLQGSRQRTAQTRDQLAELRKIFFEPDT